MKVARPNSVKIALAFIIASYAISTAEQLAGLNLSDTGIVVQIIIISVIECGVVFGIYCRKNSVRWLYAASIAIWLISLMGHHLFGHTVLHGVNLLLLALNLMFSIISVIFLFYCESNEWFRKHLSVNPLIQ
jgi:hypothetical protein